MGVILHNDDGIEWESDETIYENSYSPNVIHFVMATQLPEGTITHGIREKIWNHMKTLAGQANAVVLAIGGSNDHVHILMDIPRDVRLHRLIDFLRTGLHDWLKANVSNSVGSKWG